MTQAIGIVGTGAMGRGIALVAAMAGHPVFIHDMNTDSISAACDYIRAALDKQCSKGKISADKADAIFAHIKAAPSLHDLAHTQLVIEAIREDLQSKQDLFLALESIVADDTILATNTSSISITRLAKPLRRPERFAGLHFFNPAEIMKLVEVVAGVATDEAVTDQLLNIARAWGKIAVRAKSTPGFIVNRIARPFYSEAWRLLEEGVADAATIDALITQGGGFKMGPFQLMDIIGHDVNLAVTKSVFDGFFGDPKFRPSILQQELVDAGWLGRKSGRGLYRYDEGAPEQKPVFIEAHEKPKNITIYGDLGVADGLIARLAATDIKISRKSGAAKIMLPDSTLALTDGRSALQRSREDNLDNLVLFDASLDYSRASAIALAAQSDEAAREAAGLFAAIGINCALVPDRPGLVVMRTIAALANEASDALLNNIASAEDINLAMRNGVNYPLGPLEMRTHFEAGRIARVMRNLQRLYGDDHYRPSPGLLEEAARGGALPPYMIDRRVH